MDKQMDKQAPCKDCGKDTQPQTKEGRPLFKKWDFYLVRDEVWSRAGMTWESGHLCRPCLSKRLGRDLTHADYLVRQVGATNKGVEMEAHPDYLKHPSYVLQGEESTS